MNQPTLHTGLAHLLEASGLKSQYPDVVCFSAYNLGEHYVLGSGLEQLVKFRLLHPETPVLFFSFLPTEHLLPKDEFGVLQLAGTAFIQLPCSKETILQSAANQCAKPLSVRDAAWISFSESACKALLQKRHKEIAHYTGKSEFQLGNRILNPLRANCLGWLSCPNLRDDYSVLIHKGFDALNKYMQIPLVSEFLDWCKICHETEDVYLQNALSFALQLNQLSQLNAQTDAAEIISLIDRVNDSFEKLKPE